MFARVPVRALTVRLNAISAAARDRSQRRAARRLGYRPRDRRVELTVSPRSSRETVVKADRSFDNRDRRDPVASVRHFCARGYFAKQARTKPFGPAIHAGSALRLVIEFLALARSAGDARWTD